jgi:hypothetical protein
MAKAFYLLFLGKAVGNVPLEVPLQNRTVRRPNVIYLNSYAWIAFDRTQLARDLHKLY